MTSILENEIKCPTCKDSDCVESVRHDNCTACGWAQFTPLDQPAKSCPDKLCNEAGYCRGHKPADSGKCAICGSKAHRKHDSDKAVDEYIEELFANNLEFRYRAWVSRAQMQELVALARGSK